MGFPDPAKCSACQNGEELNFDFAMSAGRLRSWPGDRGPRIADNFSQLGEDGRSLQQEANTVELKLSCNADAQLPALPASPRLDSVGTFGAT